MEEGTEEDLEHMDPLLDHWPDTKEPHPGKDMDMGQEVTGHPTEDMAHPTEVLALPTEASS